MATHSLQLFCSETMDCKTLEQPLTRVLHEHSQRFRASHDRINTTHTLRRNLSFAYSDIRYLIFYSRVSLDLLYDYPFS